MPATSTKPAPLGRGVRDADNRPEMGRPEMLGRPNVFGRLEMLGRAHGASLDEPSVDQLLSDFVREARGPQVWSPPPVLPSPVVPSPAVSAPVASPETEQLRSRVAELETRVRALEAASQIRNDGLGRLNQRVLAVLEQLVAELRERR